MEKYSSNIHLSASLNPRTFILLWCLSHTNITLEEFNGEKQFAQLQFVVCSGRTIMETFSFLSFKLRHNQQADMEMV